MYLHYSLKQKFLIYKNWIHTTFTDSYTFPFSFSKFWTMNAPLHCSALVQKLDNSKQSTISSSTRHLPFRTLSFFVVCTHWISKEIKRQKLKSLFEIICQHTFSLFFSFLSESLRAFAWLELKFSVGLNWDLSFSVFSCSAEESKVAWFLLQNIRKNWFGVRLEVLN